MATPEQRPRCRTEPDERIGCADHDRFKVHGRSSGHRLRTSRGEASARSTFTFPFSPGVCTSQLINAANQVVGVVPVSAFGESGWSMTAGVVPSVTMTGTEIERVEMPADACAPF
jgi:hypothetical protein